MASIHPAPAKIGGNTSSGDGSQAALMPSEARHYIRTRPARDDHRPVRAASEPINTSYQPDQYDKLNQLWQQANALISSNNPQQHPIASPISVESMESLTPSSGQSQHSTSIVDSEIFTILYNHPANLQHFTITKQELPFAETVYNREYMRWVATKEPGFKVRYDEIRQNLARLSQEPILRQHSPNVFNFFDTLLRAYETYILRYARHLSYDLHATMIDAYYGSPGDVALLSRFPVTGPSAFQDYITKSAKAMSEESLNNRKRNRLELLEQWKDSERSLLHVKSSKEFFFRYEQLQKLNKIFRNQFAERSRRHRALRNKQAIRKLDRKRVIKAVNIDAWREQVGQAGAYNQDTQQIQLVHDQMAAQSRTYNEQNEVDENIALPNQMQGMNINDQASQVIVHG